MDKNQIIRILLLLIRIYKKKFFEQFYNLKLEIYLKLREWKAQLLQKNNEYLGILSRCIQLIQLLRIKINREILLYLIQERINKIIDHFKEKWKRKYRDKWKRK